MTTRNKTIIKALCAIAVTGCFASCNDFLDVRPKGDKVENDLFNTAQGTEDAIYGVYGALSSQNTYGRDFTWGLVDVLAQDFSCASGNYGADLARYNYEENEYVRKRFASLWTEAYKNIGYANNVLQNLDRLGAGTYPLQDLYRGEMLALRAMIHFDLFRLFGPRDLTKDAIPYVTTYSFSVKPFSTGNKVYEQVIADLTEAEQLLAGTDERIMAYPHNDSQYEKFCNWRQTHLNVYAVRALLARVYWYKGDAALAAQYAENVIKSGVFPLSSSSEIQDDLAGYLSPKETILGVYSRKHADITKNGLYTYISPGECWAPYDDNSGAVHTLPWDKLFNLDIDATQQDFRKSYFRTRNSHTYCYKLVDYRAVENLEVPAGLIAGFSLIRIPEMYLIAAETQLQSNMPRARELFNAQVTSRGLNALRDDEILTADRINNEFHKELFGEGQQWFNMKRLFVDIPSNAETRIIPASDDIYTVPVPKEEYDYRQ